MPIVSPPTAPMPANVSTSATSPRVSLSSCAKRDAAEHAERRADAAPTSTCGRARVPPFAPVTVPANKPPITPPHTLPAPTVRICASSAVQVRREQRREQRRRQRRRAMPVGTAPAAALCASKNEPIVAPISAGVQRAVNHRGRCDVRMRAVGRRSAARSAFVGSLDRSIGVGVGPAAASARPARP